MVFRSNEIFDRHVHVWPQECSFLSKLTPPSNKPLIRQPLLAKGIMAAGLGVIPFLTIIGFAFSYQAICCHVVIGLESVVDPPRQITNSGSVCTPTIVRTLRLFSRHKKPEKRLPRLSNKKKIHRNSLKNDFSEHVMFAIPSLWKPRFWRPSVDISTQESVKKTAWKQARTKLKFLASWIQKANIHGSRNHP